MPDYETRGINTYTGPASALGGTWGNTAATARAGDISWDVFGNPDWARQVFDIEDPRHPDFTYKGTGGWGEVTGRKSSGQEEDLMVPRFFTNAPSKFSKVSPWGYSLIASILEGRESTGERQYDVTPYKPPRYTQPPPNQELTPALLEEEQGAVTDKSAQVMPQIASMQWINQARSEGILPMLEEYIREVNQRDYEQYTGKVQAHAPQGQGSFRAPRWTTQKSRV